MGFESVELVAEQLEQRFRRACLAAEASSEPWVVEADD